MSYTIHRYPAELIDVVALADGTRLTIRPILPQDADIMQAFVRKLSDGSRRNRFFRALHELPRDLLNQFTSVDYRSHLALVAEIFAGGAEVIVGEARYVLDEMPARAEFAVAVADEWQGRGVGRLLLERLQERAASQGIEQLYGQTLPANHAMQRLARKAGFKVRMDPEALDLMRIEKHVGANRPVLALAS